MNKLLFYLTMPFRFSYHLMNYKYSKEWDDKLLKLLYVYEFTKITYYTGFLGDEEIWIANHPYASFTTEIKVGDRITEKIRPSRYTIYLARKKLNIAYGKLRRESLIKI